MTSKTKLIEEKKKLKEKGKNRGMKTTNRVFAFKKSFLLYICGMDKI